MQNKCKLAGAAVAIGVAAIAYGVTLLFDFSQTTAIAMALGIWIGFAVGGFMRCQQPSKDDDLMQESSDNQEMVSLFIGNLPFKTREAELRELFSAVGTVHALKIPRDRKSGRARGFGFVEMNQSDAKKAIEQLNGTELNGRNLRVNEAKDTSNEGKE